MADSSLATRSQFVVGLAGHIDHGKSALVQALTGGSVDRLPEEKRRGITIELGFSHFDAAGCRFALIDVPGHEKFIHTMVAGASGIDAALLVIAADDSVMPQTREHLALLELLGVQRGEIAITKSDLADDEQLELVELEITDLVAGTFLAARAPIRVSAHSGLGIEKLRQALIALAQTAPPRPATDARFRLPIDRAFSPAGQGAVVTGTVARGIARVGDTLQLLPADLPLRIRRLQTQGKDVEQVQAGERAAINLVGIKAAEIRRGDELATPGAYQPARRHLVRLRLLPDAGGSLKHRQAVRLHLGASQATAQILLDRRELLPGESTFAVVRCATPIVAEHGQALVIRQLSPAATIGGGTFLLPNLKTSDRLSRTLAAAPGLASRNLAERALAFLELRREAGAEELSETLLGLTKPQVEGALAELAQQKKIIRAAGSPPLFVTADNFRLLKQKLIRRCKAEIERRKPAAQVPVSAVAAAMSREASPSVVEELLRAMVAQRELVRRGERIGLPSGAQLSQRQRGMLAGLLNEFSAAGRAPPTLKELAEKLSYAPKDLEPLLQVAIDEGDVIRLNPAMAIDCNALEGLRQSLASHFEQHPTAKVGELRQQWGITRKHAVPIFEFFDEAQITLRQGDLRSPGPRISIPLGEASS